VLELEGGKLTAAAKHADMDPKNFWEKLVRYGCADRPPACPCRRPSQGPEPGAGTNPLGSGTKAGPARNAGGPGKSIG
jgi:hypothetical protein